MKLEINCDGTGQGTSIKINGKELEGCLFFEFTVNVHKTDKAKIMMMKDVDGHYMPINYYGGDFKKFDEMEEVKGDGNGIGRKK